MLKTFTLEAEYAHAVIGRRALIRLGESKIPVTIEGATLDPDTSKIVITASVVHATMQLRFDATDLIEVEHVDFAEVGAR